MKVLTFEFSCSYEMDVNIKASSEKFIEGLVCTLMVYNEYKRPDL